MRDHQHDAKDVWLSTDEAVVREIASTYGYLLNDNFLAALNRFRSVAADAVEGAPIGSLAVHHFKNWQPPLEPSSSNGQVSLAPN